MQINYEPFVYPVQFMDYKSETFELKVLLKVLIIYILLELEESLIMQIVKFYFINHLI
jgi:hypothetical protein